MLDKIKNAGKPKIVVIGDLMLDIYEEGEATRLSPEAPVPLFLIKKTSYMLGGAGNVISNLMSLGNKATLISVIGNDDSANKLLELLKEIPNFLIKDKNRKTTTKTRFHISGNHLLRVDDEDIIDITKKHERKIINELKNSKPDFIILSDYAKGVLTNALIKQILSFANKNHIPTLIDPKKCWTSYQGCTYITPNLKEFVQETNHEIKSEESMMLAAKKLLSKNLIENIIITKGPEGISLIGKNHIEHFPTQAHSIYDVSGAGDTVVAVISLFLALGIDLKETIKFANLAGSIAVENQGTYAVKMADILKRAKVDDPSCLPNEFL